MDEPGADPAADARDALDRLLLGGPRRYTRLQVAELAGMPPQRTQRLWRALGFPDAADDDPAFTDADIEALEVLSTLIDSGFLGPETEASIARAMGQALSRLADWQTDMLADALSRAAEHEGAAEASADDAVAAARALLPRLPIGGRSRLIELRSSVAVCSYSSDRSPSGTGGRRAAMVVGHPADAGVDAMGVAHMARLMSSAPPVGRSCEAPF